MCRSIFEGGRRCDGRTQWHVNREAHPRFVGDTHEERHWHKPAALLSMQPAAIRMRRSRAMAHAAEVDAVRTTNGVARNAPIGPVLREELWAVRGSGAGLSLLVMADRMRQVARQEGIPVEEVAERHQRDTVRPHRQAAGQRLADAVVDPSRPDWVDDEHLVRMLEPPENGTPNPAYLRVVRDADGREWVLVTSYDGSEPMVWPHDEAGIKAGAAEALARVRAVDEDPAAYDAWLAGEGAAETGPGPWTQSMTDGDFLAESDGMHLTS